jgi:hypothetical protein
MSINKGLLRLGFTKDEYLLEDYSDGKGVVITWLSESAQPSNAAIKIASDAWQAEYDGLEYSRTRANEYPPIGDQLDMQYKDLINGTTTWKDHVAKVKSDNPKG